MSRFEKEGQRLTCDKCVTSTCLIPGDYKPIADYKKGDVCLGMDGPSHVRSVLSHIYAGKVAEVHAVGTLPFTVTPDHEILAVTRTGKRHRNNFSSPHWKRTSHLQPIREKWWRGGDYLVFPRLRGWLDMPTVDLQSFLSERGLAVAKGMRRPLIFPINENSAWLLGLYVAEGCSNSDSVIFSLGKHENRLASRTSQIAGSLGYRMVEHMRPTARLVSLRSRILARAFPAWCGRRAFRKRVPGFILYNSKEKIVRAFLNGYWEGDGCRTKTGAWSHIATTASPVLALQLQMLLARLGHAAHIHRVRRDRAAFIEGRLVAQRSRYNICYNQPPKKGGRIMVHDQYLLSPVTSVRLRAYKGDVWDMKTTTGTFLVHNLLTHNCGFETNSQEIFALHNKNCPRI